jgi:MYXO-CTERM domain-containing protein
MAEGDARTGSSASFAVMGLGMLAAALSRRSNRFGRNK